MNATDQRAALAAEMERVLRELARRHEDMAELAARQRAAMSRADAGELAGLATLQGELARSVAELERARALVAGRLRPGGASMRLGELVAGLGPELAAGAGERLMSAGKLLRESIVRARREQGVVLAAAQTLSRHMDGVMKQVSSRLGQAVTYSRSGRHEGSGGSLAVDLTS